MAVRRVPADALGRADAERADEALGPDGGQRSTPDLICDVRRGGRITADGEPVMENGALR
jgi:hypothetical protein